MTLRYGLASPAQTTVRQGSGGFFGGFMKGFCFVAGTEIATPEGGKAIETFVSGDTVITLGAVNDVIELHDMGEKETHRLETLSLGVTTTPTEKFLTPEGLKLASELIVGETVVMTVNGYEPVTVSEATGKTEHVYELQCTGDNLFYANGIMAEGINEEELKLINAEPKGDEGTDKKPNKQGKKNSKKSDETVDESEKVEE